MSQPKPPNKTRTANPAIPQHSQTEGERIQKVLAHAGLASRREIEAWIKNGEVVINNRVAQLGDRWKSGDRLIVRGRVVNMEQRTRQETRVLLYHKPVGEMVTRRDPEGRPTIFSQLPKLDVGRWINVGRLDINTQGLLLVTNNGELANKLMHPAQEIEREYAVRVLGEVNDALIQRLKVGVELEDGKAHFNSIADAGGEGANHWYHVTLTEGRNRIVRRLWESQNIVVSRLIRIRFGAVVLPPHMQARSYTELSPKDRDKLLVSVGLPPEIPPKEYDRPSRDDFRR